MEHLSIDAKIEQHLGRIASILAAMAATQEKIVTATDNLNTNIAKFSTDFSSFSTDFSAAVAALQAAAGNTNDPAIQAVADKLATLDTQVDALDATAKALATPVTPTT